MCVQPVQPDTCNFVDDCNPPLQYFPSSSTVGCLGVATSRHCCCVANTRSRVHTVSARGVLCQVYSIVLKDGATTMSTMSSTFLTMPYYGTQVWQFDSTPPVPDVETPAVQFGDQLLLALTSAEFGTELWVRVVPRAVSIVHAVGVEVPRVPACLSGSGARANVCAVLPNCTGVRQQAWSGAHGQRPRCGAPLIDAVQLHSVPSGACA